MIRRAVPLCQGNSEPELDPSYYSWILAEIGDLIIPPRQNRSNPRVVKKPRSKFKSCLSQTSGERNSKKSSQFSSLLSESCIIFLFSSRPLLELTD